MSGNFFDFEKVSTLETSERCNAGVAVAEAKQRGLAGGVLATLLLGGAGVERVERVERRLRGTKPNLPRGSGVTVGCVPLSYVDSRNHRPLLHGGIVRTVPARQGAPGTRRAG